MKCPNCGSNAIKVIDTRDAENWIRRRRECCQCGQRWTTHERTADEWAKLQSAIDMVSERRDALVQSIESLTNLYDSATSEDNSKES